MAQHEEEKVKTTANTRVFAVNGESEDGGQHLPAWIINKNVMMCLYKPDENSPSYGLFLCFLIDLIAGW